MKKHVLAVAVATAFTVPAMAQNVSLFGTVDGGYSNSTIHNGLGIETNGVAAGATVKVSSWGSNRSATDGALTSNRFGIQGTEDLGGGLSARFIYEVGLDFSAGANGFGNGAARQSLVALDSKSMGSVSLGRQYSPIFSAGAAFDAGSANNLPGRTAYGKHVLVASSPVAQTSAANVQTTTRINNSVLYTSPAMGGIVASVMYAKDKTDTTGTATGTSHFGGRLNYTAGPLNVQFGTHRFEDLAAAAAAVYKASTNLVGASYNLGWATVMGMHLTNKTDAQGAQVLGYKATQIGLRAPISPAVSGFATWGNGQVEGAAGAKTHDSHGYQAGISYALSKRTSVYAAYGREEIEAIGGALFITKELAAGVRHSF